MFYESLKKKANKKRKSFFSTLREDIGKKLK